MITIGVISDTHGELDRRVPAVFRDVDHILHAGDIGDESVLRGLQRIAPVTAVSGNCDGAIGCAEVELVELDGFRFLLTHIYDPRAPLPGLRALLLREKPHAVVFGHTHAPCLERRGGVLLFNPGSASDGRGRGRSVGILRCDDLGIGARFVDL